MSAPIPPADPLQTIIDSTASLQTALAIFDTHMDGAADELPSSKLFGQIDWFGQQMRAHGPYACRKSRAQSVDRPRCR